MGTDDSIWYKDAIIYQLHVKAFFDSNDDGMGDFRGLTEKLSYIEELGVNAVWLLPFYPSPLRDDGYDIADYRSINPSYGQMRDFRRFVREAHRRGIRVITEMVINHTSDQHPWFQRARHAKPGSAWRNYYVWSDTDQKYQGTRIIFTDTEVSNWAWDREAKAYYWHRFFSHQPDLNFDNPRVIDAILDAMRFWLDAGVDGLRLDAIPYLCEREGTNNENLPETHAVLKKLRAWMDANFPDRMLLAEANQWPEDVRPYFGRGDECHMAFHFPLMPRMYMALAQEDRHPVTDIMRQTPEIPKTCQWAIFLRNHDELTLEMVTDRERDYLWKYYASDHRARINVGIRRRLAPLLDNDRHKVELLNSLLMSMPGTPIIYYGDEIGMGDNIYLGDRDGVRTPMQWSPDRDGGFSKADPAKLFLPAIMDPVYGFGSVNVEAQARSPSSLLNWMKRLISVRKAHRAFGHGSLRFLYPGNRKILAYLRQHEDEVILCIANLSHAAQPVELDLSEFKGRVPIELIDRSSFPSVGELPYFITLQRYGFYWFLLTEQGEVPAWHEPYRPPPPELPTLVIPKGWPSLLSGALRGMLERRILRDFMVKQRWFAGKGKAISKLRIWSHGELTAPSGSWLLGLVVVRFDDGSEQFYSVPLAIAWESKTEDPILTLLPHALCRVRKGALTGILYDALADPDMARALVGLTGEGKAFDDAAGGRLVFSPTTRFPQGLETRDLTVKRMTGEQSNTSLTIAEDMILKVYRRLEPGPHPELELGRHLTETANFPNTPPLLGMLEHVDPSGGPTALAILQRYIYNQGDGWTYTVDYLKTFLNDVELVPETAVEDGDRELHVHYMALARQLGVRTAEMHRALAEGGGDPAFDAEPAQKRDLNRWIRQARGQAENAFRTLRATRRKLPQPLAEAVGSLLGNRKTVLKRLDATTFDGLEPLKTRHHGDYHLGQVVLVQDDFYILDFEGEPLRTLPERRAKHSPLRDVAGMMRSFDYAAWTAVLACAQTRPESLDTLLPHALEWEDRAVRAFLEGYGDGNTTCSPGFGEDDGEHGLLDLFLLEKAFYEICYEAANRPDWLRIPVEGVRRLLERWAERP